ncbi:hypothetical protein [Nostoc sp.]
MALTCNPRIGEKMKVDGNGQGKILTQDELKRLFTEGFLTPRDRALFGICLFTGCCGHFANRLVKFNDSNRKDGDTSNVINSPDYPDYCSIAPYQSQYGSDKKFVQLIQCLLFSS